MNRIQFIGLTYAGNQVSIDDIVKFFDHTIVAYEIVGDVNPTMVHGSTDDLHSSLKLEIQAPDTSKLHDVVTYINDTIHHHKNIYGKNFTVDAKSDGENCIELFVRNN